MQVLRVNLVTVVDECVDFAGDLPLDLQLLNVGRLNREGVLAEKVAN